MTNRNSICDELKYVQVCYDLNFEFNNEKYFVKKGEILMLLEKKNDQWWLCTRDDANNDYKPFFVPANYLIELNKQDKFEINNNNNDDDEVYEGGDAVVDDDDDEIYSNNTNNNNNNVNEIDDCESPDYVNAILSELDERLSMEYNDDDISEPGINYINQQFQRQQVQQSNVEPPQVKPRKVNKDYVREHEENERIRLQEYLDKIQTPEPDYDDHDHKHEYVNVDNLEIISNEPVHVEPPDYPDTENDASNIDKQIDNKNNIYEESNQSDDDPYDISKEYDKNKLIIEPQIPAGWLSFVDRHKRKYFKNEINKDVWYLAYNKDGKPYFYSNNESIWELPELNLNANNNEKRLFDRTKIDPELKTLTNIHRNSIIKPTSPTETKLNNQLELINSNQPKPNPVKYSYKPTEQLHHNFKILKVKEKGKKLKKKSTENHLIHLASSKLLFVRESSHKAPSKLEYYLDFKGGKCRKLEHKEFHKMADSTKNKIAFNVETLDGNEVVFICDDESVVDKWVTAINSIIKQIQSEFSPIYEGPETLHTVHPDKQKYFNPTSVITQNINQNKKEVTDDNNNNSCSTDNNNHLIYETNSQKINSIESDADYSSESNNYDNTESTRIINPHQIRYSADNATSSNIYPNLDITNDVNGKIETPTNKQSNYIISSGLTNRNKIKEPVNKKRSQSQSSAPQQQVAKFKEQLIAFFKKRPTADQLKQRGILQETLFGTNLINLCNKEKRYVPEFVEDIIKAIEKKGLDMDGLYRISGNLSDVQKLRVQVNQGKYNYADFDIHVLTSTLKTFFRELEDPLVPIFLQERFIKAISLKDRHKKLQLIKELVCEMPIAHRETLKALFKHLLNVIKYSSLNRMHVTNMSLVFGPTLLRLNPLNPINNCLNENINLQNELIEYILTYYEILFDYNQQYTNSTSSIAAGGSSTTNISNTDLTSLH